MSDNLKENHPHYRLPTLNKRCRRIQSLKQSPYIGKPGRIEGTREIPFPPMPYIAVYRVEAEIIEVWRVWHTAQNR